MKRNILLLIGVFIFSSNLFAVTPQYPTAEEFTNSIKKSGVEKVIADIPDSDHGEWDYIMEHIAKGDSDWLNIVPIMSDTGAEGWNEDLTTALAKAIPSNVEGVMSVINQQIMPISIDQVCSMPLYTETVPQQNEYFVKTTQALYKSKSSNAKKCLEKLVKTVGEAPPFKEVD